MPELYFENIKTGKRFKVIRMDNERKVLVLQGNYKEFEEPYDKEHFVKMGYRLVKADAEVAS